MMKSQINAIRQLQELVLIRDEHYQTGDGSHLDSLNDSIDDIKGKLTSQVAGIFERLYKKSHIVIASMAKGCCSVCGMQVPIAQAQQVRMAQHLVTCSSCGRILFSDDDDSPHNISVKPDRDEIKTGVSRFSAEELMIPELKATTREGAIEELANAMAGAKFISNADSLVTAALSRENILPTAMENGFAFPHVRGVEGGGLTFALGLSRDGIDWAGQKVNIVFLSAIPVAVSAFYLRLLADIMAAFRKAETKESLFAAKTPSDLWKALSKATRAYVK